MASGHVNRTKRPNTWLHRPTCVREESPCQLGAVHTWHRAAKVNGAVCPQLVKADSRIPAASCGLEALPNNAASPSEK